MTCYPSRDTEEKIKYVFMPLVSEGACLAASKRFAYRAHTVCKLTCSDQYFSYSMNRDQITTRGADLIQSYYLTP